jgi:hypothetical protein
MMGRGGEKGGRLEFWEALVIAAALVAIVALHWINRSHAGALWRDEAGIVGLGTMSSISEVWRHFHLDSTPLLLVSLLHGLDAVGLATDGSLRTLGMLIGLALAGVLVLNGRWMGYGPPFLTLALIGLSPVVIRWGDSVRAYGLGTLFILLAFGFVWRYAAAPTKEVSGFWFLVSGLDPKLGTRNLKLETSLLGAGAAVIASAHTHYSNWVFIFAICTAGALVCAFRKEWRRAATILGIGLVAAVSMLIYLGPVRKEHIWYQVYLPPSIPFEYLYSKLIHALSVQGESMPAVWLALYVAGLLTLITTLARSRIVRTTEEQSYLAIYALSTMTIATVGYAVFLKLFRSYTFDWHFVTAMALVATCIEAALGVFRNFTAGRIFRVVFLAGILVVTFGNAQRALQVRLTNLDHVAKVLEARASEKDFVLVASHVVGVTFQRYFKGKAAWDTVPPLDDHRLHRWDLIQEMMTRTRPVDAITPLQEKLAETLQSGGRVWVVGRLEYLPAGAIPMTLGPAPQSIGWSSGAYDLMWSQHTAFFLQTHATREQAVDVSIPEPVSELEVLDLTMFEGWREAPPDVDKAKAAPLDRQGT